MSILNTQLSYFKSENSETFIFKKGVRVKNMTGKQPILFRILPAFDPNNPDDKTSYVPFIDIDGNLSGWGMILKMVQFVGHGLQGRKTLLSLKTFETDAPIWCPLQALYDTIMKNRQTWGYLLAPNPETNERPAFGRIRNNLICNVFDLNRPTDGVCIGVFTPGATIKLIDRKTGLIFYKTVSPNVDELIQENYLYAYAAGDITCPENGPTFLLERDTDKGDYSSYHISIATDKKNKVIRYTIGPELLRERYNMERPDTFLNIMSEEEIIQSLVSLFNRRTPDGQLHEYILLKEAFPTFNIPDPPANMSKVAFNAPLAHRQTTFPEAPAVSTKMASNEQSNTFRPVFGQPEYKQPRMSQQTTQPASNQNIVNQTNNESSIVNRPVNALSNKPQFNQMKENVGPTEAHMPVHSTGEAETKKINTQTPIMPGDNIAFDIDAFRKRLESVKPQ